MSNIIEEELCWINDCQSKGITDEYKIILCNDHENEREYYKIAKEYNNDLIKLESLIQTTNKIVEIKYDELNKMYELFEELLYNTKIYHKYFLWDNLQCIRQEIFHIKQISSYLEDGLDGIYNHCCYRNCINTRDQEKILKKLYFGTLILNICDECMNNQIKNTSNDWEIFTYLFSSYLGDGILPIDFENLSKNNIFKINSMIPKLKDNIEVIMNCLSPCYRFEFSNRIFVPFIKFLNTFNEYVINKYKFHH